MDKSSYPLLLDSQDDLGIYRALFEIKPIAKYLTLVIPRGYVFAIRILEQHLKTNYI